MNNQQLETALNENLKGILMPYNDYGGYGVSDKIYEIVKILVGKEQMRDVCVEKGNWLGNMTTYYLRYKRNFVCEIKFTRKKGDYHYGYFSSHNDYYFDKFKITNDFDFDTKKKEIDDIVAKQEQARKDNDVKMREIFKKIYAEYGKDTRSIITYIDRHYWALEEATK